VVVGCRRRGAELEIAVFDTGPGIALEQRHAMYAEFSRLDHASPWSEKGLGLGLSICDRLATLMQHTLTLESTPGRGSMFGIRVLREIGARRARSADRRVAAPDLGDLKGMRVLCVDNDTAILEGMQALLGQWGVTVLTAHNNSEAVDLCDRWSVDAVLADYHLGDGIDGIELLAALRKSRRPTPAAALISADHDADLMLAARKAGLPLLHKPLKPAALRALLGAFRRQVRDVSAA
jgi:CheY-like chemotaxis protein